MYWILRDPIVENGQLKPVGIDDILHVDLTGKRDQPVAIYLQISRFRLFSSEI